MTLAVGRMMHRLGQSTNLLHANETGFLRTRAQPVGQEMGRPAHITSGMDLRLGVWWVTTNLEARKLPFVASSDASPSGCGTGGYFPSRD